jgi:hypothetical protein
MALRPLSRRARGRFLYLLSLLYLPTSQRILEIFNCEAHFGGRVHFLVAAPYISCDSATYRAMLAAAVCFLVLYTIGILALFAAALRAVQRRLREGSEMQEMEELFGFLWLGTDLDRRSLLKRDVLLFWELGVSNGRKLVLAALLALLPFESAYFPVSVLGVLMLLVVLYTRFLPYKSAFDNTLEVGLLFVALLLYQGSVAARDPALQLAGLGQALAVLGLLARLAALGAVLRAVAGSHVGWFSQLVQSLRRAGRGNSALVPVAGAASSSGGSDASQRLLQGEETSASELLS